MNGLEAEWMDRLMDDWMEDGLKAEWIHRLLDDWMDGLRNDGLKAE